jgi:hypothetical protein
VQKYRRAYDDMANPPAEPVVGSRRRRFPRERQSDEMRPGKPYQGCTALQGGVWTGLSCSKRGPAATGTFMR